MKSLINKAIALVDNKFADSIMLLFVRIALAAPFWFSARTKVVEGSFLTPNDTTALIFENEFGLSNADIIAPITTYAEHIFPVLLVLGLATRFSSAGLFVMTLVIQSLVPSAFWTLHMYWFVLAIVLIVRGGGALTIDRLAWKAD